MTDIMEVKLPSEMGKEEEEEEEEEEKQPRYRQYLIDRTNGNSKLDESKPPCFACFVPLPVIWLSCLIEQNRVFECLGACGCVKPNNIKARRFFIGSGLVFNITCLFLSIYSCLAISNNFGVLWVSSFTSGTVFVTNKEFHPYKYDFRIGVRGVAGARYWDYKIWDGTYPYDNTLNRTEFVAGFDEFCTVHQAIVPEEGCKQCLKVSDRLIFTLIVSTVMCVPSITTSFLRLYEHYDCNCQKVFGSFAAIISVAFAIYTMVSYQYNCFYNFGYTSFCMNEDGDVVETVSSGYCPDGYSDGQRIFHAGVGWCTLAASVALKGLDMIFHFIIPTPTICRDRDEQYQYETLYSKSKEAEDELNKNE